MAACAMDPSSESSLLDDDESIKNRLFARAMQWAGYTTPRTVSPLRVFLRLAEHIAQGILSDFKSVASDVTAQEYIDSLSMENLQEVNIGSVTFDAARPCNHNFTYLRQWALWSNRASTTDSDMKQSFEFIRRNGGVTFDAAMAFPRDPSGGHRFQKNAYYLIAESSRLWAVQRFVGNPILASGFNICHADILNRTPLVHSITEGQQATARRLMSVTGDETLNRVDRTGKSALLYAVSRDQLRVLYELLCRPALDMNNSSTSVYRIMDHMKASNRQQIMQVFDQAAALFAGIPLLIHETVYHDSCTTLPLPICDIIFNYYRMPYPIRELGLLANATPVPKEPVLSIKEVTSLEPLATKAGESRISNETRALIKELPFLATGSRFAGKPISLIKDAVAKATQTPASTTTSNESL